MIDQQPTVVSLTDAAVVKLQELTKEETNPQIGLRVYVDGQSVDLLKGAQIDYVDTLMGAGFTVNNPNAVAACGCGVRLGARPAGCPAGRDPPLVGSRHAATGQLTGWRCRMVLRMYGELGTGLLYWLPSVGQPV